MKRLLQFILSLAREIADENAYSRYLQQHGLAHSGDEWRKFSDHRHQSKYSQAKCC